jgi:glycosyltransferase involved in cell wall biosynthesis
VDRGVLYKGGRKMRILYCGLDQNLGGIESFVVNMYRLIDKEKFQIDFLKITDSIYYEEEFLENGSIVYKIPSRRSNPLRFFYSLYKFLKDHKEYTIIHHHLNSCSSIEPIVFGKLLRRKTIAHSHNVYKGNKVISRLLNSFNKQFLYLFSDLNIACSYAAGVSMFKNKKFSIINNGIDAQKYEYDSQLRDQYRKKLSLTNKMVVGHIGSFKYQKNHEFLIDIFYEIKSLCSNSELLLVGDGEKKKEIKEKVERLNIADSVIFLGIRHDVASILQAMDVFVFPSRYEGLGIVAIEAQAAGLYSLVSNAVPKEAFVTNLIESVPSSENAKDWAVRVLNQKDTIRCSTLKEIKESGYDSYTSARMLERIYLDLELKLKSV